LFLKRQAFASNGNNLPQKLVKDFMRSLEHYSYIKEDETVQEAMRLMDKVRKEGTHSCLFVVGEEQYEKRFIKGFVTGQPDLVW